MNLITVMIVDDEKYAIENLTSLCDWEANGYKIVATANNGKQALSQFREKSPQLVITDIKMPFMDGLELIRAIKKLNIHTKILLLTAYGEFDYAQQAIRYGITDYMLKSEINEQTITAKLRWIQEMIESEKKTTFLFLQKLIVDLFNSDNNPSDTKELYEPGMGRLLQTAYYYLIIEEDLPLPLVFDFFNNDHDLHHQNEIISYSMSARFNGFSVIGACSIRNNQILLVIQPDASHSQYAVYLTLTNWAGVMQREFTSRFQLNFTIYIINNSLCLPDAKKLISSFSKRFYAKYLLGNGKIYEFQNQALDWKPKGITVDEKILAELVEGLDSAALLEYIDQLYEQIMPPEMDYESLVSVSQVLYAFLKKQIDALPSNADKPDIRPAQNRVHWLNALSIKEWMLERFKSLISERRTQLENKYSPEVMKAIAYIYKNFSNKELKIDQIAECIGLSSARLSIIFKKETGSTINEFITAVRIKKAKELLDKGSYKVYEIADRVGYGTSQYFSQIFLLTTGVSPNIYRKGGPK
jgi:two-component system response regulator YesN